MLYRFLRAFSAYYGLLVLGLYILAFFATFALFLYPPVAVVLLFVAIYALVPFWAFGRLMRWWEHAIARKAIRAGRCPSCEEPLETFRVADGTAHECTECTIVLTADGEPWTGDEAALPSRDRAERVQAIS